MSRPAWTGPGGHIAARLRTALSGAPHARAARRADSPAWQQVTGPCLEHAAALVPHDPASAPSAACPGSSCSAAQTPAPAHEQRRIHPWVRTAALCRAGDVTFISFRPPDPQYRPGGDHPARGGGSRCMPARCRRGGHDGGTGRGRKHHRPRWPLCAGAVRCRMPCGAGASRAAAAARGRLRPGAGAESCRPLPAGPLIPN